MTVDDAILMQQALQLALRGRGRVAPNPLVGAILVDVNGDVVGQGWHLGPGTDHAEVAALREAGSSSEGATLYTTLEPCTHTGQTPPCSSAIIAAGVGRVVIAITDPNPAVPGGGAVLLREAGISVTEEILREEATEQNRAFLHAVRTGRPFVTLKMAASLDGKTAARDGSSQWITSTASREDVQRLRADAGAILIGSGTALADDPHLTVRESAQTTPLRVVLDARGRLPASGNLFDGAAPTLVVTTAAAPSDVTESWRSAGAEVLTLDPGLSGGVSLPDVLKELGARDIDHVLIEGGAALAAGAIEANVVDRLVVYIGGVLLGGLESPSMLGGSGVGSIAEAVPVSILSTERIGPDLKVVADVHWDR